GRAASLRGARWPRAADWSVRWADATLLTIAAAATTSKASPCLRTSIVTAAGYTPRAPLISRESCGCAVADRAAGAALAKALTTLSPTLQRGCVAQCVAISAVCAAVSRRIG